MQGAVGQVDVTATKADQLAPPESGERGGQDQDAEPVVVVEPWSSALSGSGVGVLACLIAALSYAIAYTYQGRYLTNRGVSSVTLTALQLSIATAMLAATLPFSGTAHLLDISVHWTALLVLGVAGTGLALIINFTLIGSEGAVAAIVVAYLVPAVALTLGVVVLNESASLLLPVGGIVILVGVGLVRNQARSRI